MTLLLPTMKAEESMEIIREDVGSVRVLTLNRPDRLNVLDTVMFRALEKELSETATDKNISCVVLRGAGRSFCAGHDMTVFERPDQDEHLNARVVSQLAAMPQPTIAAIHGHCYTGGLELALGCDILVASGSARLADTHAKFGLSPGWGLTARLPQRVGYARALEMMGTCRIYSAAEAKDMGLVSYVWEDELFWDKVMEFAAGFGRNSAQSVQRAKTLLRAQTDLSAALDREWVGQQRSDDSEERVIAFLSKGK